MVPLDVRNERDQPVTLGDPWACDAVWFSPKLVAPGESWGGAFMIVHPLPGQYRVRSELLWSGERNFYSDFATVTVQP